MLRVTTRSHFADAGFVLLFYSNGTKQLTAFALVSISCWSHLALTDTLFQVRACEETVLSFLLNKHNLMLLTFFNFNNFFKIRFFILKVIHSRNKIESTKQQSHITVEL